MSPVGGGGDKKDIDNDARVAAAGGYQMKVQPQFNTEK